MTSKRVFFRRNRCRFWRPSFAERPGLGYAEAQRYSPATTPLALPASLHRLSAIFGTHNSIYSMKSIYVHVKSNKTYV